MTATDALTITAGQIELILIDHSVTYTTTDNRGKEEGDYRVTVGDVTAYLTMSDDGDVWATTDEKPADAYDGPANADEIALHLMGYADRVPRIFFHVASVADMTGGASSATYMEGYWEIEDSHTTVEVDTDGGWTVTQSTVDGIDWNRYQGKDMAAVFQAGALADEGQELDAIQTVIDNGDYEGDDWWSIVEGATDLRATDGDAGTRVFNHWGSDHPGVLVTESTDVLGGTVWNVTDLDTLTVSVENGRWGVAANVIHTLA